MKRLAQWTALLIVLGVLAVPTDGEAAGFANTAQSATSTGMGGVGIANPNEGNATFYNPALMGLQDGFRIYVGPTLIIPNTTYEAFDSSVESATETTIFPPPNLHAHYSITDNLAVGVGATFPFGLGVTWPDDWVGREDIIHQSLQTLDVTPAVSYTIPSINLTIAGGAQFAFSSLELERNVILRSDTEVETKLAGDGHGYGGIAGIVFQPTENITIGANYRSAVKLNYDGRAHFDGEKGTPFEQQFVDGEVTTDLTVPHFIGVGFGWQLKRLFLELDLNYHTWSTYDEVVIDFKEDKPDDTTTIVNDWSDAGAIRFGASYEVIDQLPVRLGLGYDRTPIPDDTVNASLPGNHRAIASLGVGYTFDFGLRLDGAYELVAALEREIENDRAPNGRYQTTAHLVGINVGYGY